MLLSRDADGAPRFVDWFYPSPRDFGAARRIRRNLATFVDLEGGYADQTHFSTRRWYDEQIFPRLPESGTCMEHVLHPEPASRGGVSILKKGTYALEHGPHLRDAVHGLVTTKAQKYLPGLTWQPVSDKNVDRSHTSWQSRGRGGVGRSALLLHARHWLRASG